MPFQIVDRAKEQASTTGTGDFTLGGAVSGMFVAFSSVLTANGDTTDYCAENPANNEWEAGILTRTSSTTYSRTVLRGTNGASPVNFTAAPFVFSTVVADHLHAVGGPCFRAYRATSDQGTITSLTPTKVQLNAESFDYGSCFDSTTNHRFTPNVAGLYRMDWNLYGACSSGTQIRADLYKNGALASYGTYSEMPGGVVAMAHGSDIVAMNGTTDYLELYGYVGGTSILFKVGEAATFLAGTLVRRAG